jgi:Putative bacterial sensory transduction regulator
MSESFTTARNAGGWTASEIVALVERWTANVATENSVVTSIEKDATCDRWFVRARGDEKLVTTLWVTVREETVNFETYFMPSPEENIAQCFEYLLRVNQRLYAYGFAIGGEDAVYLSAQVPFAAFMHNGEDELDRMLGAAYAYSEECFRTAMRIGFATKFTQ